MAPRISFEGRETDQEGYYRESQENSMQRWFKIAVISSITAFFTSALQVHAESGTNVSQVANIVLSGFRQMSGPSATVVRITTKDIIIALNASGNFNFGSNARLVLISHDDQMPKAAIREGTGSQVKTTNISQLLTITQPEEIDASNNLTSYAFRIFKFNDQNGTSFRIFGLAILRRGSITNPNIGPLLRVRNLTMEVSGEGSIAGDNVVLRGTINAGSPMSEID